MSSDKLGERVKRGKRDRRGGNGKLKMKIATSPPLLFPRATWNVDVDMAEEGVVSCTLVWLPLTK